MKRILSGLLLALFAQTSLAEIVYCRFEVNFGPVSLLKWDDQRNTIVTTTWNYAKRTYVRHGYANVKQRTDLPPYGEAGKTLMVAGHRPAIHIKYTGNGTIALDPATVAPMEAYWGLIVGGPKSSALDKALGAKFSPRGICWTDEDDLVHADSGESGPGDDASGELDGDGD